MQTTLSNIVIISDIDGTLAVRGDEIPGRNIEALKRFTGKGGRFGIATGRSKGWCEKIVQQVPINLPSVFLNGGAIFDYQKNKYLKRHFLPAESYGYVEKIREAFPDIGILVITEEGYWDVNNLGNMELLQQESRVRRFHLTNTLEGMREYLWYKIMFLLDQEQARLVPSFTREQAFEGVRFTFTNSVMYEMIPNTSTKANAITDLMSLAGVARENLFAIGDYDNDIEMLQLAGTGVTLPEAPDKVKAVADLVVGPCSGGCLADLVEYLEGKFGH